MKLINKNKNMQDIKTKEINLVDLTKDGVSNCCSANVYQGDICSKCKEHCEVVNEDSALDEDMSDEDTAPEERLTQEELDNLND